MFTSFQHKLIFCTSTSYWVWCRNFEHSNSRNQKLAPNLEFLQPQVREGGSEREVGDQRGPVVPVTRVHLPEPDVQQERLDPEATLQLLLQLHLCASFISFK